MIMSSMVLQLSQLLCSMTMMFIHTAFTTVKTEDNDNDDEDSKVNAYDSVVDV